MAAHILVPRIALLLAAMISTVWDEVVFVSQ